jgi:hypothetical protein
MVSVLGKHGAHEMTYETRREAEAAKASRQDGNCFYVYQMSDGYWALGRYASRTTASGYAGL